MYNYIGIIRKSNAITHCICCNFFGEEKLNLILSKTDRIEFYDLTKEGLIQNRYINIYGKINLLLSVPSRDKRYKSKDNIFVLSEDLDFALFSYNKTSNNIDSLINGSIKEEIGRKQDNILYSLDILKNFLLISAFKNVFKLICVNNEMRIIEKYKDFTIKYTYEDILFLAPFSLNYYLNDQNKNNGKENRYKNLLAFATIKTDIIENRNININITDVNNNDLQQEISFETFQIKIEINNYIYYPYICKNELIYKNKNSQLNSNPRKKENINNKSNKNSNFDNDTYSIEDINLFQKIDISENPTVSLMITHPDGIVILFFSNYILYYIFDQKKKKLIPKKDKKISYTDRRYTGYTIVDEKEYKYFVIDEYGNLFLLAFITPFNDEKNQFIFQFLGEINYSTCLTYLDNNYLFVGSYKSNSQLIKIESKDNSFFKVVENYESLAPISNLTLINNNVEDENNVELLTISGIEKNCCIKTIKKGTPAIFQDEIEIKNIKNVFKISLDKNKNINTFIVITLNNSFIIDYDIASNQLSLNNRINFHTKNNNNLNNEENEIILFAQNIFESVVLMVTNSAILLYKINDKEIKLVTRQTFNNNYKIKPLLMKYNERLCSLFIYFNNKKFLTFKFNENGEIIYNKELLNNVNISSFGICKYFIIYSLWDKNKLGIYTINTSKNNFISKIDNSLDFIQISSIEIIKIDGLRFIIISLSNGKILFFKLKEQFRDYNYYEFTESDFIFKRKYNLSNENFTIQKIKIKDNTYKKYLFLDTSTPSFIYFNKETPILINLNLKYCKNIIQLEQNKYLFIYNHKIVFGSLSNAQSQNVHSKLYGKQLYNINSISFGNYNLNVYKGEGIEMKENNKMENLNNNINKQKINNYILTIEEEKISNNNIKSSLVLSDLYLKEISRYIFENQNEVCTSFSQIYNNNDIENKLIVAGTGISENLNEEPVLGHIYLIEIDSNNNYLMKKITETETKGGIYKVRVYKNIIYVSIGNTFLIYKLIKNFEINKSNLDSYEIKYIRKCNDFTLINDIYIFDYNKNENNINFNKLQTSKKDENKNKNDISNEGDEYFDSKIYFSEEEEKKEENKSKTEENIHYLIISDLYRSIVLYSYDVNNDKFSEICRDYNLTWVYGISQYQNNLLYISDIDGNIVTLEKNNQPKSDQEKFKFERRAYFNLGERINSLVMTSIKNHNLYLISSENNQFDINNSNNYNFNEKSINTNNEEQIKVTYFGTLEGSVGVIFSLNKEVFDFLKALQNLIIKKMHNNGNFSYQKWRSFKDGFNLKTSKGFIEGEIIEDFLNYDEQYKNNLLNELNYPWNKSFNDVINIIETLAKCH